MDSENYKGGFRELEAWKEARIFLQMVIEDCKTFPAKEKYLLMSQIKDSSRSVTANMAEGYGRYHYQETSQFFRHSRGSLSETLDHYITALNEGYISEEKYRTREIQYGKVMRLTNGYIKYLQRCKKNEPKEGPKKSGNPPIP